jgi:hypothetical protein
MKTFINKFQRDVIIREKGSQVRESDPRKFFTIWHVKFCSVFGFGYWKDIYKEPFTYGSHTHNIILPFLRIQFGRMYYIPKN